MITNFEEITIELTVMEMDIIPALIRGFSTHSSQNPIKAPAIIRLMNNYFDSIKYPMRMTEAKLRKCVNHIRAHSLAPVIATSSGYYISHDQDIIRDQIKSLTERANSIRRCADGLASFISK